MNLRNLRESWQFFTDRSLSVIINKILDIDYDIYYEGNLNEKFRNESIYLIHYPEGKTSSLSINTIRKIHTNNVFIEHLCSTEYGSSGAPIILLNTFRAIGVHTGKDKAHNYNYGIVLAKTY